MTRSRFAAWLWGRRRQACWNSGGTIHRAPRTKAPPGEGAHVEDTRGTYVPSVLDEHARRAHPAPMLGVLRGHHRATRPARVPGDPPVRPSSRVQGEGGRRSVVPVVGSMYVATCTEIYANPQSSHFPYAPVLPYTRHAIRLWCEPRVGVVLRARGKQSVHSRKLRTAMLTRSTTASIWSGVRRRESRVRALGTRRLRNNERGRSEKRSSAVCSRYAATVLTRRRVVVGRVQTARRRGIARRSPKT